MGRDGHGHRPGTAVPEQATRLRRAIVLNGLFIAVELSAEIHPFRGAKDR